jgi:hypothetical protein
VKLKRTGAGAVPDRLTKAFAIYFTITFMLGLILAVGLLIAYARGAPHEPKRTCFAAIRTAQGAPGDLCGGALQ